MTAEIATVEFYGDRLQVVGKTREEAAVVLRPACEALGLDFSAQVKRLKEAAWAVVAMTATTGSDGKRYEMLCVSLDTLPMWLATIDASRVRPEVREKLARYQREAAKALAAHFLRPAALWPSPEAFALAVVERLVPAIASATARVVGEQLDRQRVAFEEAARSQRAVFIPPSEARLTCRTISDLAAFRTRGDADPKAIRRERSAIDLEFRARLNFPKITGNSWSAFPASRFPELRAAREAMAREVTRGSQPAQLALLPKPSPEPAAPVAPIAPGVAP